MPELMESEKGELNCIWALVSSLAYGQRFPTVKILDIGSWFSDNRFPLFVGIIITGLALMVFITKYIGWKDWGSHTSGEARGGFRAQTKRMEKIPQRVRNTSPVMKKPGQENGRIIRSITAPKPNRTVRVLSNQRLVGHGKSSV